jgi:hypothetical protein
MGVMHFAGLGKSVGAVTSGLSCIVARYSNHNSQYGDMVDSLVIFTSPEVANGTVQAFPAIHNEYMSSASRKTWTSDLKNCRDIVTGFMQREFPQTNLYLITVDINDFSACFDVVAKAILTFHTPGTVGKHIWANITGGSNLLNAALVQAAFLSGFIARLYYTFVADPGKQGKYLKAFSKDESKFRYREIFPLKTRFGERTQFVLEMLDYINVEEKEKYVNSKNLLSRLKGKYPLKFGDMNLQEFKRNYLNVMQGIERYGDRLSGQEDAVRISADGNEILKLIRRPLFRALVKREQISEKQISAIIDDLPIELITFH